MLAITYNSFQMYDFHLTKNQKINIFPGMLVIVETSILSLVKHPVLVHDTNFISSFDYIIFWDKSELGTFYGT